MFRELYNLLRSGDHYGVSEEIEILKGKYAKPNGVKDVINKSIRAHQYKKRTK